MAVFNSLNFENHEGVHFFADEDSGLKAIIAVHNTVRGPGAGGTRLWQYSNEQAALDDVLNLSKAMSYKNAMADIPFGGGKGVIIRPEGDFDRKALFAAYGRAVESLGGIYCTAEDVGVTPSDMEVIRTQTKFVGGLDHGVAASGDPSPVTAEGVFRGLKVAWKKVSGQSDLGGVRVAVQGLGHVGYTLAEKLVHAGAKVWAADINENVLTKAKRELGAVIVPIDEIHTQDVDIFAPCALGGAVNPKSLPEIKARIIGGAANNQLSNSDLGIDLLEKGILYCPDYVINGGGIINVASELSGTYDPKWVDARLDGLSRTLKEIFEISDDSGQPTNIVADKIAKMRITSAQT